MKNLKKTTLILAIATICSSCGLFRGGGGGGHCPAYGTSLDQNNFELNQTPSLRLKGSKQV